MSLLLLLAAPPADAPAQEPAAIAAHALELQKQGQLEAAAGEYRRFLQLAPGSWQARSNLGVLYAQLGDFEKAVEQYRQALAAHPDAAPAAAIRYNLAVALYKAGRTRDAADELAAVLQAQPDHPQAPLLLADCRLQLGEWKRVIAILDPLLEKDPENPAILYMIGTALMRDRQYQRGQRVLDRILRRGDSAEAHLVLAIASREASDDIAAEKELRRALELDPQLPSANAILGEVLVKMGDAPGAMAALRREIEINPNHFDAHLLLALLLRQDGRNDEALEHVRKALLLRPGDPGARYQLALCHVAKAELETARQALEPLVKEEPSFTEAHVTLAMVYFRLGRREDGVREQAVVQRLNAAQKAREEAEKVRQQAGGSPSP
ncbi:MAG TPA: tetratricopeptide repeat protein [Vicinamibacteria bacterium]|nr:tetratricopeptide repeat protein [Vicinamibacteria bacterium]